MKDLDDIEGCPFLYFLDCFGWRETKDVSIERRYIFFKT